MTILTVAAALNLIYVGALAWFVRRTLMDLIRDQRRALAAAHKLEAIIKRAIDGEILVTADDGRIGQLVIEQYGDAIRLRVDEQVRPQVH